MSSREVKSKVISKTLIRIFNVSLLLAEQVVDGLDRAVMTMKKGEVALVSVAAEYGYQTEIKTDLAVVPPKATLIYEVELVSFVKVCIPSFSHCGCFKVISYMKTSTLFLMLSSLSLGERVMGHEHRGEDRGSWEEERRRECII